MITSIAGNLVVPSSWALAQSLLASWPQEWTHQAWADGPGSTSKVALATVSISSLDAAPRKWRKPSCRWCTPNINSTWSPGVTTPVPALPSSRTSQLPSVFGKPLGTQSSLWQMSMATSRSQPGLPSARPTPSERLLSLHTHTSPLWLPLSRAPTVVSPLLMESGCLKTYQWLFLLGALSSSAQETTGLASSTLISLCSLVNPARK